MRKFYSLAVNTFIFLCLFSVFFTFGCASTQKVKVTPAESVIVDKDKGVVAESKEALPEASAITAAADVKDKQIEAEAVKKEVEVYKKEIELEKKKAEIKVKEAEVAKKEAVIIGESVSDKEEIKKALEKAKKEEEAAKAALEKIGAAEEKMLLAQQKAQLVEEELAITKEKAAIAEAKLREKRKELYTKLIQTGVVIVIGYLLIFAAVGIINRQFKDLKVKHAVRKNVVYLINFLIILSIVFVWLQNINSITIIFSVMGAGLALALQEMILCIAGWFAILLRRPFEVGDRIEFGGVKGDVIDVRLVHTSLLEIGNWVEADQSTGRIANVPNSAVFKKEIYNYSRGFEFIWNEIKILVTFESDWKRAEEIMMKHAVKHSEGMEDIVRRKIDKMSKRYMIYFEKFTPIVYSDIKDSGVELSLRYLTEDKKRRTTQDMLCRAILSDFKKEENVNFAYTTYRIVK